MTGKWYAEDYVLWGLLLVAIIAAVCACGHFDPKPTTPTKELREDYVIAWEAFFDAAPAEECRLGVLQAQILLLGRDQFVQHCLPKTIHVIECATRGSGGRWLSVAWTGHHRFEESKIPAIFAHSMTHFMVQCDDKMPDMDYEHKHPVWGDVPKRF